MAEDILYLLRSNQAFLEEGPQDFKGPTLELFLRLFIKLTMLTDKFNELFFFERHIFIPLKKSKPRFTPLMISTGDVLPEAPSDHLLWRAHSLS